MLAAALAAPLLCCACLGCGETRGHILWALGDETPTGISLYDQAVTGSRGGLGGVMSSDSCPNRQAVTGFQGTLGSAFIVVTELPAGTMMTVGTTVIGSIQTLCGSLAAADGGLTIGPGDSLAARGGMQGAPWQQQCPPNEVVVGFTGRTGDYVDQLGFLCAPWPADVTAEGGVAATALGPSGGDGGAPFAAETCAPGQIAIGSVTRSGVYVDSLALLCATPALAP